MSDPKCEITTAAGSSVRGPRIAVTAVFVVHGLLFASWTAHIPDVKAHLGLTDGTLGFALLGAPVGSVTAMIASSWLLSRVGSRGDRLRRDAVRGRHRRLGRGLPVRPAAR